MAGNPFGEMFILLPLMYVMNKIDFQNPDNLLYVRVSFGITQTICFLLWGLIIRNIHQRNNQQKIKVPKSASPFAQNSELEEMTINSYDLSEAKKAVNQLAIGLVVIGLLHIKWEFIQPLFIQTVMIPMQLYKNPLCKIHILGEKGDVEKRPFKEESPIANLMNPVKAQETQQVEEKEEEKEEPRVQELPDSDDDNAPRVQEIKDDDEDDKKKKKKKK